MCYHSEFGPSSSNAMVISRSTKNLGRVAPPPPPPLGWGVADPQEIRGGPNLLYFIALGQMLYVLFRRKTGSFCSA